MKKVTVLVIDGQVDFCDLNGSLYVKGAEKDAERLLNFCEKNGNGISNIFLTLDSHNVKDVSHPKLWIETSTQDHPKPFTPITFKDISEGKFRGINKMIHNHFLSYVETLEKTGRYTHLIWPEHCLIGSPGAALYRPVYEMQYNWASRMSTGNPVYLTKGSNWKTEHFSPFKAEVPDPKSPETSLNIQIIKDIENSDLILVAGWASSHCLRFGVMDLLENFGTDSLKKFVLLSDCTSPVPGFEQFQDQLFADVKSAGGTVEKSINITL